MPDKDSLLPTRPALIGLALSLLSSTSPGELHSQPIRFHPAVAIGIASQDVPYGGQSGPIFAFGLPVIINRFLAVTPSLEFGAFASGAQDASCFLLGDGSCLQRPGSESFFSASFTLGAQLPVGRIRTFVEAGPALVRSLAHSNPGEKRQVAAPSLEAGLRLLSSVGRWSLSLRWRSLDRWSGRDPGGEYALILGFRPDKRY